MAVAKRQRREKACGNRTKEGPRTEVRISDKTALLAISLYIGRGQGEEKNHIKRGAKILFPLHLLGWPTLMPRGCIFLCF